MERSQRKMDHIRFTLETREETESFWDDISFPPNSLPNIYYGNIELGTTLAPFALDSPIIINAMTGGAAATTEINRALAVIARERGLAMAVGSQMAALRDEAVSHSYQVVRKENPTGLIFANLGAEATVDQAMRAVEMIEADGLQIHLNVMQELLMPEGDRDFRGYLDHICEIKEKLPVPVMVKEVGFGMAKETIGQLIEAGISLLDVGGRGGTNFAKVENKRHHLPMAMFENWGFTTAESLLETEPWRGRHAAFIATGGIRNGLDAVKAIALGASAVGIAGSILRLVQTSPLEMCLEYVDLWHHQMRVAMTALGAATVKELQEVPVLITGKTAEKGRLRGWNLEGYARRGSKSRADS
ncbi:type 2 isopentenyl-diphosphate Delta-isomerase [Brevibacillus composti]|uniref:Isopentenyl-diphosphate delta-isomerase n=1 Tax=Brevibacillus composti TaxID=2796470 RepID=A0A7T5EHQ2_9BACL|nr:type 2 isopentenyl-diphosphate Delta-isomerase [Brevibacillus composti]QQE72776.1 type 2 isopentenyl-diphosphate Delta-isomerase [Brevibacillus composti]QUO39854.1 type 2 isopentenyl-diphosphate Delta-isomerase [Brevibacillus composti]